MLGKLLKYELKATARTFIPIYIAILVTSFISTMTRRSGLDSFLGKVINISNFVLFGLFVALVVITFIVIIQRFYSSLMKDEGYLMFTLPVSTVNLILSKFIITLFWNICSGIVAIGSFIILFSRNIDWSGFQDFINLLRFEIFTMAGVNEVLAVVFFILTAFAGYAASIFLIYLSIAVGQLPSFNKYRIVASFIAFFVINMIINQISAIPALYLVSKVNQFTDFYKIWLILGIWQAIVAVGLFLGTHYILSNQLNLE